MVTWRIRSGGRHHACCLFVTLLALGVSAFAQTERRPPPRSVPTSEEKAQDASTIGPGDVLDIKVADSPEISGKYRVTETGDLALPFLSTSIRAAGATTLELSKSIAQALKAADILRDPVVTVFVQEYHSWNVMVLGAVAKPSVYSLEKRTTVLELLSKAGGLTPTAGNTLTIASKGISPSGQGSSENDRFQFADERTLNIDLGKLVSGRDPSLNVEVHPGDVVSVPTAPIVYVVGAVVKPGGFALQDPRSGLTVLRALALVEGFKPDASPDRAVIVRQSATAKDRQEIPVDLNKVMTGKLKDEVLEGNDILFIPESSMKKGLRRMGDFALQAASQIAGYGIGLRVAR